MKVKILGTEYEVIKDAEEKDYPQLKKCDGFTDFSIKRIVVANFDKDESSVDDIDWYKKKVLRHELVHAFIHESGLAENCDWARNEELTDWIAIQFEKILGVFIELQCIDSIGVDVNIFDRQSNNPINDPINSPKVKVTKASIKDNTEIINEIGKAINKIPIEINLNNLAKGGIIGGDG
jgi:hypothetical protein|nr:MAG TPA: peptidase [Caudoviricetes sp.]